MNRKLWPFAIMVALASVVSCSDLLRVDWAKIDGPDDSSGGEGGEGGEAGAAMGGAAGQGGEPNVSGDGGEAGASGTGGAGGEGGEGGGAGGAAGTAGSAGTSGAAGTAGVAGTAGTAGSAGTSGAGGSSGSAGSAGSAGSSGSGGSGPCGDGSVVEPEVCDQPFTVANCGHECLEIESVDCSSCIDTAEGGGCATFDCSLEVGNAQAGPAAGRSRLVLCQALLDCMYVSNCAAADPVDCYCGTAGQACQTGGGNGACRSEIEGALESTSFGDIGARIGDPSFAGGVAVVRVDCSRMACGETCGALD